MECDAADEIDIRLDERLKVMSLLIEIPCSSERKKCAEFFNKLSEMKFETQSSIEKRNEKKINK